MLINSCLLASCSYSFHEAFERKASQYREHHLGNFSLIMDVRYLHGQCGKVAEVHLPGKALLIFRLNDEVQRALLWTKSFIHQGKCLATDDTFQGKLEVGDTIYFDCHTYHHESRDQCQWYAAKASKTPLDSDQSSSALIVVGQTGHVFEVEPGKGVLVFNYLEKEHRVFFLRSKFYSFGKRPGSKHSLKEFISENDPVQFDATRCEPFKENKMCDWFATVVWKGKKPTAVGGAGGMHVADDMTPEDSASNTGRDFEDEDFPSIALTAGLADKQGYKAFEASSLIREGRGFVLSVINEECGIALWLVRQNTWETVFFHRKNAFILDGDINVSKFDIQESFAKGTYLDIMAIPAVADFPCRWIARKAVAK